MHTQQRHLRCGAAVCLAALSALTACGEKADTSGANPGSVSSTRAAPTSAAAANPTASAVPAPPQPRTARWVDLTAGDCLAEPPPTDPAVVTVTVVDCSTPHLAETFLRADVPVDAAVTDVANQRCDAGFATYTGRPAGGSDKTITYLIDSEQDRTSNNPYPSTVICLLQSANGQPMTGSARR